MVLAPGAWLVAGGGLLERLECEAQLAAFLEFGCDFQEEHRTLRGIVAAVRSPGEGIERCGAIGFGTPGPFEQERGLDTFVVLECAFETRANSLRLTTSQDGK